MMSDNSKPVYPVPALIAQQYQPTGQRMSDVILAGPQQGMTLREFYAGLAMYSVLSNDALLNRLTDIDIYCQQRADGLIKVLQETDDE
jgi:hypothetical protein